MARPDSWMPMYWRDFWADTTHLSEQEGWAYLNLIGTYWTNGGPLPNDDIRLQRMARCTNAVWKKVKATVTVFFIVDGDVLRHGRIDSELKEATRAYDGRVKHIQLLNEKRRQKRQQTLSTDTDTQLQPHLNKHSGRAAHAANYLNDGKEGFQPTPVDAETNLWRARILNWQPGRFWNHDQWGPSPNDPACKAPKLLLDEWRKEYESLEIPNYLRRERKKETA